MEFITTKFAGLGAVEIKTKGLRLAVITDFGPRVAFWGRPEGENLLLWAPGKYFRNKWELYGGHRVWVTRPLADEGEETYLLEKDKCQVERIDSGWTITTPPNPFNCTKRGITVKVLGDNILEVDNFMVNTGDMLYSGGVWALTCTVPGKTTRYGIPIGDANMWDYCRVVMFRSWDGHTGGYNDDQFSFGEDMMYVQPKGKENKRMLQADKGIIAMHDTEKNITFIKKVRFNREGSYPNGCNLAVYIGPDNFMVEMETMGAEKTVKPGEVIHNKEIWILESAKIGLEAKKLEEVCREAAK